MASRKRGRGSLLSRAFASSSDEEDDGPESKVRHTLGEILELTSGETLLELLGGTTPDPPRLTVPWEPDAGPPPDTRALAFLDTGQRNRVRVMPAFQSAELYLESCRGGPVELEPLRAVGWTDDEHVDFDERHACYVVRRDRTYLLLAATPGEGHLVYWIVLRDDPQR